MFKSLQRLYFLMRETMEKLHIRNITLWGSHGVYAFENEPQPFTVEYTIETDMRHAAQSDKLENAVDYTDVYNITKKHIEGAHIALIEKLATNIIEEVVTIPRVSAATIRLTKLQPRISCTPTIEIRKVRTEQGVHIRNLLRVDRHMVKEFYSPKTDGVHIFKGLLYKYLPKEKLLDWYQKCKHTLEAKEEKYIANNQKVSLVFNGSPDEMTAADQKIGVPIHKLYAEIREAVMQCSDTAFTTGDRVETKLILYPPSTLGVGPHKDLSSNVNLIVLMNIYGTTKFYTAEDKEGKGEKVYMVEPGDVLIMRGPRNQSEKELRMTHYVKDVDEERLVFVCREIDSPVEEVVNKGNWMNF